MKKVFTLLLLLISGFSYAQDAMFYQKNSVLFHYNPALVGAKSDAAVCANHRSQWANVYDIYYTNIQGNYNFKNNVGVGLVYQNETFESLFVADKLILNGNYSKSFEQLTLLGGFNFNWTSRQLNGIFIYEDDTDPSTGYQMSFVGLLNTIPANYISIDFGIAANYKNFVFGLSTMQVNEPKQSFSGQTFAKLPARLIGSIVYSKPITTDLKLGGQAYYQKQAESQHLSILANGQYKYAKMGLGIGYPLTSKALEQKITVVMQAGLQFDKWSAAYNYDVWKPNSTTFSSHEISAAWFIKGLKKDSKTADVLNALL